MKEPWVFGEHLSICFTLQSRERKASRGISLRLSHSSSLSRQASPQEGKWTLRIVASHFTRWGAMHMDGRDFETENSKKEEGSTHTQVLGFAPSLVSKSYFEWKFYSISNAFWSQQVDLLEKNVFLQWHSIHSFTPQSYLNKIVYRIISLTWSCSNFFVSMLLSNVKRWNKNIFEEVCDTSPIVEIGTSEKSTSSYMWWIISLQHWLIFNSLDVAQLIH